MCIYSMIPEKKQIINKKTHQGIHNNTSVSIDKERRDSFFIKINSRTFFLQILLKRKKVVKKNNILNVHCI